MLCGVGSRVLGLGAVAETGAPKTSGGQSELALVGLPEITVTLRVDAGIVGGENTGLLVILEEVLM